MDKQDKKFAQDAFVQAQRATLEREAEAFQEFTDKRGMNTMLAAVAAAGLEEMARIVDTVQRMVQAPGGTGEPAEITVDTDNVQDAFQAAVDVGGDWTRKMKYQFVQP